jgi:hypothetical protein
MANTAVNSRGRGSGPFAFALFTPSGVAPGRAR